MSDSRRPAVVLLYKRNSAQDTRILELLERELIGCGCHVFIDRHVQVGLEWAREIESRIRAADAVVVILTEAAVESEMLQFEVEAAIDESRKRGRPFLLPVRVGGASPLGGGIGGLVNGLQAFIWECEEDDPFVAAELCKAALASTPPRGPAQPWEPAGGAVPPDSPYYIARRADEEMVQAIRHHESIVLVRGPRQIGKTTLIGRGTRLAKELGLRVVCTDFQMVNSAQLSDADLFARMLAATLSRQLEFHYDLASEWQDVFGPNLNLANFIRLLLKDSERPLVWFIDEADRLFTASFSGDFFGLLRSWHNARATEPMGPWNRLTLVIAYATEARLFIRDLNQSPFNVGRHLKIANFTLEQTMELNDLYGGPVQRRSNLEALHFLLGGQPFLVRRALEQLATGTLDFEKLIATADQNDGPFGDHLRRLLVAVSQFPDVVAAMQASLRSPVVKDSDSVERLVAAGVLQEDLTGQVSPACDLYAQYLGRHLSG